MRERHHIRQFTALQIEQLLTQPINGLNAKPGTEPTLNSSLKPITSEAAQKASEASI